MPYVNAHIKLASLSTLGLNWDSYGALPIEPEAIRRAGLLLDVLEAAGFEEPAICGGNGGGVVLEWGDWEIEVESVPVDEVER